MRTTNKKDIFQWLLYLIWYYCTSSSKLDEFPCVIYWSYYINSFVALYPPCKWLFLFPDMMPGVTFDPLPLRQCANFAKPQGLQSLMYCKQILTFSFVFAQSSFAVANIQ